MESNQTQVDVVIIGAGPSGSAASALLRNKGYSVLVVEKQHFPRFVIGESLLPQCMVFFEEAGFLPALYENADNLAFQTKNGAYFTKGDKTNVFDFSDKFSIGPSVTWEVKRGVFDQILINESIKQGAEVRYGHSVIAVDCEPDNPLLTIETEADGTYQVSCRFLLDASGYGRVLPKLFAMETPSDLPVRRAIFTHIEDNITDPNYDRNKIIIAVHAKDSRTWFWLIPFSDGRCSLGVVAELDFFQRFEVEGDNNSLADIFSRILHSEPNLAKLLENSRFDTPFQEIKGYSANVKQLFGKHFALLGNAGEFLDPVFSSGVTIALKSVSMAVPLVDRELKGETVDWLNEYEIPLREGINVFRVYVEGWYNQDFQDVVFSKIAKPEIKQMICSLLAGYAWDKENPMYQNAERKLQTVAEICRNLKNQND